MMYGKGEGVLQDHVEAAKWYRLAAEKGQVIAQSHLGIMYLEGDGVQHDYAEAVKWFRLAAERGDPQSQYNLALSYAKGETGEPDNVSAYMWFSLAAARFPASDALRATAIARRDQLMAKMTPTEVAEAQRRSREWQPK